MRSVVACSVMKATTCQRGQVGIHFRELSQKPRPRELSMLPSCTGKREWPAATALEELARGHERPARVFELRAFGGLTIAETAALVGVSQATVEDDWALARAWLWRELSRR